MNLHPKHYHYDTVACSTRKPKEIVQSCVGYWVCFGTRGVVICKSREVEIRLLLVWIIWEDKRMEG
jgi:hypothetical protein